MSRLTPKQLKTLISLVEEERQFWNESGEDEVYHGRDKESLDALSNNLSLMLILGECSFEVEDA